MLLERFGRDQQELLIRQLFHIAQTATVQEYITQFCDLVDQLVAYGHTTEPIYYTMRFIDGLRSDIRSAVHLQRPKNLDSACSLALLQEELGEPQRRDARRPEPGTFARPPSRTPLPLPPPPQPDKAPGAPDIKTPPAPARSAADKFSALRALRRTRGLCDRCAETWVPGHRCAASVQLHAMQEVFDLFPSEEDVQWATTEASPQDHSLMALSSEAVSGISAARSLVFDGLIQSRPVVILLDSGSSSSFVCSAIAQELQGISPLPRPVHVRVANGDILVCSSVVSRAAWSIQHYQFSSDLQIIPLQHFDMVLGMDWLSAYSPMKIDWQRKWISLPYLGSSVTLYARHSPADPDLIAALFELSPSPAPHDTGAQYPPAISQLLTEFATLFEPVSGLPPVRHCDHQIPLLPGAQPFSVRSYRYPPALKDEIETQVQDLLTKWLIQPSTNPFSSPLLLVKKKDGSWQPVIDYRYLNALTVRGQFPIPVFDELMDELAGASWFSTLDLNAGFHQIRLQAGEEPKTAFQTHLGHYEFKVMSFGLCGAPGTFQGAMNFTLQPLLRKCALVFFDDILVYSKSFADHVEHLRQVFQLLLADSWKVKLSKCSFAQRQIAYLGHIISQEGISTDQSKVEAVSSWPVPSSVKELRSFLGMAGYYRKFVRHFAILAKPLTELLKKNALFVWTSVHQDSFAALKAALISAPVLAMPDFTKPFCVETDACAGGVGAVLLQGGHPLAYISKPLGPKTSGLSTYEKEYLAILLAVEQWRIYLQHQEFTIYTDQRSLAHLADQRLNTPWQQRVFTKLLGLQYKIQYKPGMTNAVADALSRRPHPDSAAPVDHIFALSSVDPSWISEVISGYSADPHAIGLLDRLAVAPSSAPPFVLSGGLLRYHGCIWLGSNSALQHKVMSALHDSPVGGHSGFPVTYRRLKQLFAWRGMKSAVKTFVAGCSVCQQAKPDRSKLPGLLLPLPVPSSAWQIISMDFVEGLPRSQNKDCILVVVDKFTKYGHFIPLSHPFTAATVAKAFFNNVYRLHGLPESIISDRDRVFTAQLWQELFKLAGVTLRMSSSYHPQTDGQTERVNQCMETFLRCYVHACPSKWLDWLSLAEYWYNTSSHSALACSPFEALYGRPPRSLGITSADACSAPELSQWLQERSVMTRLLQQHLLRAQQRMKRQADKSRSERQFSVGDLVYLKLQPYVQSSLAARANQKLAFKFFGPFRVLAKINEVAYKLELPAASLVHPIFHVSQLKAAVPASVSPTQVLPELDTSLQYPLKVLDRRLYTKGSSSVFQVLVQWSGWPESMAT